MSRCATPEEAFAAAGLVLFQRGWLSSNNVLFLPTSAGEGVLVDTGYWSHQEQTLSLVRRSLEDRPLARIINTHLHSDHCGGNAALCAAYGCEVLVPSGEEGKARAWDEDRLTYRATGQHCPRFPVAGSIVSCGNIELGDRAWEVIPSPGHDPESFVLYQRDLRLLISADALWENGFGVVFPELEGQSAFNDLASTLDALSALAIDWIIPGHGRPFTDSAAAIDRARRRLEAFVADPRRHAAHAARVLTKFHLLEVRGQAVEEALNWMIGVPYLQRLHADHFGDSVLRTWCLQLIGDLCRSGAARMDGQAVVDA
ncbi:MAG: MBL fold metallo-hydrolase [Piscinibacter sp.]|nr:MBL fold metallo-hydrolase [Piscinibacter sp.]